MKPLEGSNLLAALIKPRFPSLIISDNDKRHPKFNSKFSSIHDILPRGESLKNVIDRLQPFWKTYVDKIKKSKGNHLIVAHSNSLRAIVKILDKLSHKEIISVNIPTGVPLVYTLNNSSRIIIWFTFINFFFCKKLS